MTRRLFVLMAVLSCAGAGVSGAGAERLQLRVSPNISTAPGTIVVTATIPPNVDNRSLGIGAESESFYRSSEIELDGDRAPLVTQIRLKNLPSGEYNVVAILRDSQGHETSAWRKAIVLGKSSEPR